jgi:hypothetical protein
VDHGVAQIVVALVVFRLQYKISLEDGDSFLPFLGLVESCSPIVESSCVCSFQTYCSFVAVCSFIPSALVELKMSQQLPSPQIATVDIDDLQIALFLFLPLALSLQ